MIQTLNTSIHFSILCMPCPSINWFIISALAGEIIPNTIISSILQLLQVKSRFDTNLEKHRKLNLIQLFLHPMWYSSEGYRWSLAIIHIWIMKAVKQATLTKLQGFPFKKQIILWRHILKLSICWSLVGSNYFMVQLLFAGNLPNNQQIIFLCAQ